MTDAELDRSYTALCEALGEVGRERSELLLAMIALGLIARSERCDEVIALVARAKQRCLDEGSAMGAHAGSAARPG